MMESIVNSLISAKSENYHFNKMSKVLTSLCMVFLRTPLQKVLPYDPTLPSTRGAASEDIKTKLSSHSHTST